MGIYYSAAIILGRSREDISKNVEDILDLLDNSDLTEVSTVHDGYGDENNIIGFVLQRTDDYSAEELQPLNEEKIAQLKEKFRSLTGLEAGIYLSTECT